MDLDIGGVVQVYGVRARERREGERKKRG